jgi:hypothetical protein
MKKDKRKRLGKRKVERFPPQPQAEVKLIQRVWSKIEGSRKEEERSQSLSYKIKPRIKPPII